MDKQEALRRYFGYDAFRPGQEGVVDALLSGRDALCVMPTGAGKSLCYQIPALLLEGVTVVISPLISLMKDQVAALNEAGVRAAYLNSSLTPGQYRKALENAANFDKKILVEEFINGREVEVAVLGNDAPAASVCGEIDAGTEFYDYDAKYISDCARLYIPARIDEETSERVRDTAIRVFEAMGCRGLSRVDFFVTYEGNEIVFNEINTIPGFTSISMYPKLFDASGIPYTELLDDLIELATEQ